MAHSLAPRIGEAELRRAQAARDHDLSAYQLLLKGRRLMMRLDGVSFDQAGDLLRRTLDLDAGHARALALLGHSYTVVHKRHNDAQDMLERALQLSPNDAGA